MRKVLLTLEILAAVSFCIACPSVVGAKYSGGTGDPNDPYQIANVADLMTLANDANDYNKCFILTADVNLQGQVFTTAVIASDTNGSNYTFDGIPFTGTFDGMGHKITKLTIDTNGLGNGFLGLFGDTNNATIKNLRLEDVNISTGGFYAGGLVGVSRGTITNCSSTGSVTSSSRAGGLVGASVGTIINCSSTGSVTSSSSSSNSRAGGLVGTSVGTITNCSSSGSVNSYCFAGGLVGFSAGTITNCSSTGSVTSSASASNSYAGGLVGYQSSGTITDCYSTGSVTSSASFSNSYAGGLVGYQSSGTITDCYSTGSVSSLSYYPILFGSYAGGLVGWQTGPNTKIERCYSIGQVSATGSHIYKGGLLGYQYISSGTVTACFWDTQTSGLDISAGGEGKTTAQMQDINIFLAAGWDFVGETANGYEDDWRLCNEGLEYPKLAWQYLPGDIVCSDGVDISDLDELCEQWLIEEIPADLAPSGGDGIVDFADFAVFADQWGVSNDIYALFDFTEQWLKTGLPVCSADISPLPGGDGRVNFADFAVMGNNWLEGF